ncbi:unnamed protein product [Lampetra planeri]
MRNVVVLLVVIDYNYDDDDETTQEPDVCGSCHVNATCMTKDEALKCVCNKGLSGNGKSACRDNDECRLDVEMLCGTGTSCFNTFGSFYCRCAAGYLPSSGKRDFEPNDGTTCAGEAHVDECAGGTTACGAGASCENRPGAFACRCLDGYVATNGTEPFQPGRDGTFCVRPSLSPTDKGAAMVDASLTDLDCNAPPELNGTRVKQVGKGPGATAHYRCIDEPEAQVGQWSLVCSTNGTWQGQPFLCSGARKSPSGAKVAGVLALVVAAAASAVAGLVFLKKRKLKKQVQSTEL